MDDGMPNEFRYLTRRLKGRLGLVRELKLDQQENEKHEE